MKKLQINRGELLLAFESSDQMEYFLDLATGEILMRWEDDPVVDEVDARLADGPDGRYEPIEAVPSWERFEVMRDFVESLPDSLLKTRLARALEEKRPFRRFRDALCDYERVRDRWYAFEQKTATAMAERWLEARGVAFEWVENGGDTAIRP